MDSNKNTLYTDSDNVNSEKIRKIETAKKIWAVVKFALLIFIIVAVPLYVYVFHRDFISSIKDLETVGQFLESYKTAGIFIYIGFQILQIIIAAIPGQALQLAAGYLYGIPLGYVYSLIGALAGTVATFYLARFLGKDALFVLFGKEKLQKFIDKLNSKRAFVIVFILYLIPGIPKDLFNYAIGVSDMPFKAFLFISIIGRTPGMIGSLAIGYMYRQGSYTGMFIVIGIAVVLFVLGIIYRDKVTEKTDEIYNRLFEKKEKE